VYTAANLMLKRRHSDTEIMCHQEILCHNIGCSLQCRAIMPSRIETAAASLVERFRRQRPLRAGSLIVTIFGDSIAPRGGRILLGSLIRLVLPFGVTERLVRTSVARLAQDGWLAGRRDGRHSEYRLSAGGRMRFADATRRIYSANPVDWSGRWTLVLPAPAPPAVREQLRRQLQWLGFGQLTPGVFAHLALSPAEAERELGQLPGAVRVLVLKAKAGDTATDRRVVTAGWDLAALAGRYRQFTRRFEPLRAAFPRSRGIDPQIAFVVRTLLVHEFRKIHLRDPLLPASLLPGGWIGFTAYDLCRDLYGRVFPAAETHLSTVARRRGGVLPAPDSAILRRFGGLPRA
jgi:phenylacetic acid degradation operon negative regulatory protein